MSRSTSPIAWFGGKGFLKGKLIPLFPAHKVYVEPCGGGAAVLLAKPPSDIEIYNDVDEGLVHFFRVLRDPATFDAFHRRAVFTPYSRLEWSFCRDTWATCPDPVERAYRWFVVARMSFSGQFGVSWSSVNQFSRGHSAYTAYKWIHTIDGLAAVHARLMRVQVEHLDYSAILDRYDSPNTLFYIDPPYVHSTRGRGRYAYEFSDQDHAALVARACLLKGMAIISGYAHPLYTPLEAAGWQRLDFPTYSYATGRTRKTGQGAGSAARRLESVWFSPSCSSGAIQMLAQFAEVSA